MFYGQDQDDNYCKQTEKEVWFAFVDKGFVFIYSDIYAASKIYLWNYYQKLSCYFFKYEKEKKIIIF